MKLKIFLSAMLLLAGTNVFAQSITIECGSEDNGGMRAVLTPRIVNAGGINWAFDGKVGQLSPDIDVYFYTSMYKTRNGQLEHELTSISFATADRFIGSSSISLVRSEFNKPFYLSVAAPDLAVDPEGLGCHITVNSRSR